MTVKVKVNIVSLFNRAIDTVDELLKDKVCPHCEKTIETDYEIIRNTLGIDTGFQIVVKYLQDIAERAIKIDDPIILECLLNLQCVSFEEAEEKEIIERAKAEGEQR